MLMQIEAPGADRMNNVIESRNMMLVQDGGMPQKQIT
jgi:hypothetical protein